MKNNDSPKIIIITFFDCEKKIDKKIFFNLKKNAKKCIECMLILKKQNKKVIKIFSKLLNTTNIFFYIKEFHKNY